MKAELQDIFINIIFFVSIWILADKTPKRKMFALRAALSFAVFTLARYVIFYVAIAAMPAEVGRYMRMLGFVILMAMATGAAFVCYDCNVWTAIFCGSTSYLVQNICQRIYSIIVRLAFKENNDFLYSLVMLGVMALVLGLLFLAIRKLKLGKIVVDNKYLLGIVLLIIATAVVLDLVSLRAIRDGNAVIMRICTWLYSIVISALIFALLVSLVSGGGISEELRQKLGEAVDGYDSSFDTGNPALDVILTRKNFRCKESDIELTCAVNGESLSFMSEVDVYSLFGNILDNAIEASEKLEDKDKRVVSLSLEKKDYFIYVHAENYFSGKLSYSGGLPKTTKSDGGLHGYGIKSIRMLTDKYGGSTKIDTKEDRFMLDLMFPI